MTNLITDPNAPERQALAAEVQALQFRLGNIQSRFTDDTLAFKAGSLAYEAARLFWYAVKREDDGHHLEDVARVLAYLRLDLEE